MAADAEKILVGWLKTQTMARLCTELPADLSEVLPVIRVSRYGGSGSLVMLDRASVDVDCYADSRGEASALAGQVRDLLLTQFHGFTADGATVARVRTINAPGWAPYDNTSLRRFHASYMVSLHIH